MSRAGHALLKAKDELQPDFLVASGDLVQWAESRAHWRAARDYLERFELPYLTVPGNHDIARLDICTRFLDPYKHYKQYIHQDIDRAIHLPGVTIVGLATPKRWTIELGHLTATQLEFAEAAFSQAQQRNVRIMVIHHPIRQLKRIPLRDHVRGNLRAIAAFQKCGVHVLLSGHKHWPHVERVNLYNPRDTGFIWAQAGTATTKRFRPFHLRAQSVSIVDIADTFAGKPSRTTDRKTTTTTKRRRQRVPPHTQIDITPYVYNSRSELFEPTSTQSFRPPNHDV